MRKILGIFTVLIGLSMVAVEADARRVGGGRSIGKQQSITPNQAPRAPAQQQAAPNAPTQQQAAAPAAGTPAKPSGMSRFLGPLAGLAIGAGLASLFLNNGLGGALMGMLLIAALVIGVVFLVRMFRGRGQQQPLRYAGATPYGSGRAEPTIAPAQPAPTAYSALPAGAAAHSVAATTSGAASYAAAPDAQRWPADFNADEFVRHAKVNFVKVQEAHDRHDVQAIRDFLTPELAAEIEAEMRAAGDAPQKTDVITLNGEVLNVVTDAARHTVSVRFSGLIREAVGAEPQPFSEIWHLDKPVDGSSGWQVSGIQQA